MKMQRKLTPFLYLFFFFVVTKKLFIKLGSKECIEGEGIRTLLFKEGVIHQLMSQMFKCIQDTG